MSFLVSFKNMDSSPALEEYAQSKINDVLTKFLSQMPKVHLTFEIENMDHVVHCHLHTNRGHDIVVHTASPSMYASIDYMIDKLSQQLKKEKDKLKTQMRGAASLKNLNPEPVTTESLADNVDAEDIAKYENGRRQMGSIRAAYAGSGKI